MDGPVEPLLVCAPPMQAALCVTATPDPVPPKPTRLNFCGAVLRPWSARPFKDWIDVMAWVEADEEKLVRPNKGSVWIHHAKTTETGSTNGDS